MDRYAAYKNLKFENTARVLTVTLAPPTKYNAINGELHRELSTVFAVIREDRNCDAVVVTGQGHAFAAGADLHWLRDMTPEQRDDAFTEGRRIVIDILECPQPTIAAINGPAVGLGATIALLCDVKIASAGAMIGDPHVSVGVVAGDGGAVIWPWLIGSGRAKRYLMTGDLMPAEEAERIGLIEQVVPEGEALAEAQAFARRLQQGHQRAIRGTKISVNKLLLDAANTVLDTSLALEKETMCSEEHRRAVDQFLSRSAR